MACSESRSICMRRAFEYRISVIIILPCLRQFHRRPSWFVNQREKKCLGIILILAAGTCCEKIRKETLFKNSNSYRQENLITSNSSLSPLAKIDDQSRENFLLKYLLLKGKNRYLFEKLNTKNILKRAINCTIIFSCRHLDAKV